MECNAKLVTIEQSVEDIHTRFENRMELNHISTTKSKQFPAINVLLQTDEEDIK